MNKWKRSIIITSPVPPTGLDSAIEAERSYALMCGTGKFSSVISNRNSSIGHRYIECDTRIQGCGNIYEGHAHVFIHARNC